MSEFKVGDVGLTRGGRTYKVIYASDTPISESGETIVALITHDGATETSTYHDNGNSLKHGRSSSDDLMPPSRIVYLNLYRRGGRAKYYNDAEAARANCEGAFVIAHPIEISGS